MFLQAMSRTGTESNAGRMDTGSAGSISGERFATLRNGPTANKVIGNEKITNSSMVDDVFSLNAEKTASLRAPPSIAQTAGLLPPQYNRVRAARQNFFKANYLGGVGGLAREPAAGYPGGMGALDVKGDSRQLACQNVHNLRDKLNMSMSISPDSLECLACPEKHAAILPDKPVLIVVTDQNFSPLLPAKLGLDCVKVLRVEDGMLVDLHKAFRDVFRAHLRPAGVLPAGSVVMVGSLSHLALFGVQQYIEDLDRVFGALYGEIGNSCTVIPAIFVPLSGIQDDNLIRDMADLDAWILNTDDGPNVSLPVSRHLFWQLAEQGCQNVVQSGARTLFVPISLRNPRKQRCIAGDIPLPAIIAPFDEQHEEKIICGMVEEVVSYYGLNLDPSPNLARGGAAPSSEHGNMRLFFVGASHTKRLSALAEASNAHDGHILPRWAPTKESAKAIVAELAALRPNEDDILILDLFSNMVYMGTDEDGMAARPFLGSDGVYHIPGNLEVATQTLLKNCVKASLPILEAASMSKLIFTLPLPRYASGPCCSDPEHITNLDETDYDHILREAAKAAEKTIDGELKRLGRDYSIYDPLSVFDSTGQLALINSSSGVSIWTRTDPVHLTQTAYSDVLDGLLEVASETAPSSAGRERLASIIPVASTSQTARPIPVPAWIRGEESNWRGAQRGRFVGRGGRRGRGGRWRPY